MHWKVQERKTNETLISVLDHHNDEKNKPEKNEQRNIADYKEQKTRIQKHIVGTDTQIDEIVIQILLHNSRWTP